MVATFDKLTHQSRTINTHSPTHQSQGRAPKPQVFYMIPTVLPSSTIFVRLIDNNQPSPSYLRGGGSLVGSFVLCQRYAI